MRSNSSHYDMTPRVRWLSSRDNTFVTKILYHNLEITTDYCFLTIIRNIICTQRLIRWRVRYASVFWYVPFIRRLCAT